MKRVCLLRAGRNRQSRQQAETKQRSRVPDPGQGLGTLEENSSDTGGT